MSIRTKIIIGYLPCLLLMILTSFYAGHAGKKYLLDAAGHHSLFITEQMMKQIIIALSGRVNDMEAYIKEKKVIDLLNQSNDHFSRYDEPLRAIREIDATWKRELGNLSGFQKTVISSEASHHLRKRFIDFNEKIDGVIFFRNIFITNRYGANIAQTEPSLDYNQSDELWWQMARKERLYLRESHLDESGETHGVVVAIRIDDQDHQFLGVIKALIPTRSLTRMAKAHIRLYESTRILLINRTGKLLYASEPTKLYQNVSDQTYFDKMSESYGFFLEKTDQPPKLISYMESTAISQFKTLNWILILKHLEEEVLFKSLLLSRTILIITASALFMAFIIIFWITGRITRPLKALNKASKAVAKGRFNQTITCHAADEIGELAETFNRMTRNLDQSYQHLNKEISIRKKTETALKQTNIELKQINSDLEQYASIASHDLQEPLRKVKSYLELITERYESLLDEDGKTFIGYATDAVKRMQNMIRDLLEYSRTRKKDIIFRRVDMNRVLDKVLQSLSLRITEEKARVFVSPLPEITGDDALMEQLFFNLIGNAIKYRSKAPPMIEVSAERTQTEIRFSVTDNGIGIDPAFHRIIFQIFQRLYKAEYRKGNGIGLAIVKRIVEHHGGTIGIHSTPGQGSTFFFTIPLKPEVIAP